MYSLECILNKIVIYSEIKWDFLDQRHHHLARYAAVTGLKVEFVERVVSRVPEVRELLRRFKELFVAKAGVQGDVHKPVPHGISLRRSRFLPPVNTISRGINNIVWLMFERRRQQGAWVYSFVDNPAVTGTKMFSLRGTISTFDIIHNWWDFPWNKNIHSQLVSRCIEGFRSVVTDSPSISQKLDVMGVEHHLMLPGVNREWLGIAGIYEQPKVVFFGNLRSNSDIPLVRKISEIFSLDAFGVLDQSVENEVRNVNFKGSLLADELVKRISDYNVILLPYKDDGFSRTIAPAKYFESLATGALVVTMSDMSHLPGFQDYVLHVKDLGRISDTLCRALEEHSAKREAQIEFAKQHTWEKRFKELFEYIDVVGDEDGK